MNQGLITRALAASAPLFIWAAHFFACYLLVAARCSPALYQAAMPDRRLPGLMALLALLSLLALLACLWLSWRAWQPRRKRAAPVGLFGKARLGAAVLGTIGVALTSIPVLLVDGCR